MQDLPLRSLEDFLSFWIIYEKAPKISLRPQRRIFLLNLGFIFTPRLFSWQCSVFDFFLEDFLSLRPLCRLERLSKIKFPFFQACNNIFLSSFQSFIDKLFKDWQASIYLVPKPSCHKFLWNSPDFGSTPKLCMGFLFLNIKSLNLNNKKEPFYIAHGFMGQNFK